MVRRGGGAKKVIGTTDAHRCTQMDGAREGVASDRTATKVPICSAYLCAFCVHLWFQIPLRPPA